MIAQATIAGLPVALSDWTCDTVLNHGHRSLSGKIPEAFTAAEQEAPVSLWLPNGDELWAGKLALDPVTERGKRSISARGYASDISADEDRMLYRIDGGADWVESDSDPHNYVFAGIEKFDLNAKRHQLAWKVGDGSTAYATNDRAGYLYWAEGTELYEYSLLAEVSVSFANMNLQVLSGTGSNGTLTADGTHALTLGGGGTATYTGSFTKPNDMAVIRLNVTGAFTPAARQRVKVTSLQLYGRTNDPDFTAFDVVDDVAFKVGFDRTHIQSNSLKILPLDWTEDHADLLSYMADLCDWHWEAYGPALHFGPWETTWTAHTATGARPTWENLPRFNTVRVPYTHVSGAERSVTVTADPNPFPDAVIVFEADALENPQSSATLAREVAANMIDYYAVPRVAGRLELATVYGPMGRPASGAEVRPGHLITVPERADLGPQRVVGMTYRENGYPVAEVNDDFNVVRLLDSIRPSRRRRRRRRRRDTGGPVR